MSLHLFVKKIGILRIYQYVLFYSILSAYVLTGVDIFAEESNPIGKSYEVTCSYDGDENFKKLGFPYLPAKGNYHYQAYLPKAYGERTQDRFPILFVMSPGGNVNIGAFASILEQQELIGVGLQEARNGDWEPIIGNFLAAHDDAIVKFRVDEERKFATGFSGGARGSSLFTQVRPGFAGLVLQGAGYWFDEGKYAYHKTPKGLRVFMIMGKEDSNKNETELAKQGIRGRGKFKLEIIEGGHSVSPLDKLLEAIQWVMLKEASELGSEAEPTATNSSSP